MKTAPLWEPSQTAMDATRMAKFMAEINTAFGADCRTYADLTPSPSADRSLLVEGLGLPGGYWRARNRAGFLGRVYVFRIQLFLKERALTMPKISCAKMMKVRP